MPGAGRGSIVGGMVRPPTFTLVHPDDVLVVDVITEGFDVRPNETGRRGADRFALHVPAGGRGLLTLRLPPQELLEGSRSIVTDPSEAVFEVTPDDPPIATTGEGILGAAHRLPRLATGGRPSTGTGPAPGAGRRRTLFDRPYVLHLRLAEWSLRLIQDTEAAGHDGPIGLWSTEVAADADERPTMVWFDVQRYRVASGPWSSGRSTGVRRRTARLPSSKNPVVVRARVSTPWATPSPSSCRTSTLMLATVSPASW